MSSNVRFIQLESYKSPKITESKTKDWVEFGDTNNQFNYLIDLYNSSTTNSAIINNFVKLAYGKGLSATDGRLRPNEYARFLSLVSKETIKNVITDAKMLGNYAFQMIYDGSKRLVQVEHVPFQLLRAGKCNDKGEIDTWFYSDNWADTKKFPPKPIPAFGFGGQIQILKGGNYTVGQKYYSNVDYYGALPYCVLEKEVADYLINEVQNSFSPTTVVNFNNGVPDPEKMELMVAETERTLTGANGKKVVIGFNSDETKKTTVDSIPLNDAPEHYKYVSEEAMHKIMLGHNVTSPLLFGIATSTGFSSNADELKNSHILYENMTIKPFQQMILDTLDIIQIEAQTSLNLIFDSLQPLTNDGELTLDEGKSVINSINTLSPLVANKVLESMTANEIRALVLLPPEQGGGNLKPTTTLSSEVETPFEFADALINKGETVGADWILIDESDVDLELENDFDAEIERLNKEQNPSLFQKFAKAITARPNSKSEQDKKIEGLNFITRYKYTGSTNPQRDFCKKMMSSDKIYRKEDIVNTDSNAVNAGFGHNGQSYNLFLFKGGARCHHKWVRQTYVSGVKVDVTNPNATTISVAKAEQAGYRVRNPKEVAMMPKDMPNEGFYPN
jgi:hypothetical protein